MKLLSQLRYYASTITITVESVTAHYVILTTMLDILNHAITLGASVAHLGNQDPWPCV